MLSTFRVIHDLIADFFGGVVAGKFLSLEFEAIHHSLSKLEVLLFCGSPFQGF